MWEDLLSIVLFAAGGVIGIFIEDRVGNGHWWWE